MLGLLLLLRVRAFDTLIYVKVCHNKIKYLNKLIIYYKM